MTSPGSPACAASRSNVPDLARARASTPTSGTHVARAAPTRVYLRGTGADHHLLALHPGARAAIRDVTCAPQRRRRWTTSLEAAPAAGGTVRRAARAPIDEPGGGSGVTVRDPDGRRAAVRARRCAPCRSADEAADRPIRLAHAVLNSHDVAAAQRFMEHALGFTLVDRTRIMAFMNCNRDHHSIALGDADNDCLNHIAFVMPDLESVMRGGGRMHDAGFAIEWGPGRHGPGNNAFNYFVGPFGVVIEYTAEVEQVDESYLAGGPDDWKWPAGRVDHWGISPPPSAALKEAQRSRSASSTETTQP